MAKKAETAKKKPAAKAAAKKAAKKAPSSSAKPRGLGRGRARHHQVHRRGSHDAAGHSGEDGVRGLEAVEARHGSVGPKRFYLRKDRSVASATVKVGLLSERKAQIWAFRLSLVDKVLGG